MSAYMVEKYHIGYLVQVMFSPRFQMANTVQHHLNNPSDPQKVLAEMLHLENAKSITYRYPQDAMDDVLEHFADGEVESMCWPHIDPVQVMQSVACYQYQSCEHPGWETSLARQLTDQLFRAAARLVPGYDNAVWGAPEPASGVKRIR